MCVLVCMYLCTHTHTHVCVYICMYMFIYVNIHTNMHIGGAAARGGGGHPTKPAQVHICVCIYLCIYIYISTYIISLYSGGTRLYASVRARAIYFSMTHVPMYLSMYILMHMYVCALTTVFAGPLPRYLAKIHQRPWIEHRVIRAGFLHRLAPWGPLSLTPMEVGVMCT